MGEMERAVHTALDGVGVTSQKEPFVHRRGRMKKKKKKKKKKKFIIMTCSIGTNIITIIIIRISGTQQQRAYKSL